MTPDIRICFVGDSFVNGTGDETALGWVGRLCAAACQSGTPMTYYNLGVRRDTSRDLRERWHTECARRLPSGCDGRVVFSCGVNDTMIENGQPRVGFEESLDNLRALLKGASRHKVLLVGPPPVADAQHNTRIQRLAEAYAREAANLNVSCIDVLGALAADADYQRAIMCGDGAHPNGVGYARMAALIGAHPAWWFHGA
ncbi:MAG: GDSL-type esterase/lipase family protein [Burkholderiales bacterium]